MITAGIPNYVSRKSTMSKTLHRTILLSLVALSTLACGDVDPGGEQVAPPVSDELTISDGDPYGEGCVGDCERSYDHCSNVASYDRALCLDECPTIDIFGCAGQCDSIHWEQEESCLNAVEYCVYRCP